MTHILKKISAVISVMGIIAALGMPVFVNAQTAVKTGTSEFGAPVNSTYTLLEPLPCIVGTGNNCTPGSMSTTTNIQTYIVYVFKLMIALAVLAAVVMCIVGGFEYMLTDSVNKKVDAKGTIKNALLGLAGALGSFLILYTINPNLVNVSLVTVPKLNVATTNINLNATSTVPFDTAIAQQAAAGVAQDNALQAQVTADDANETNLGDQYNACTPQDSAACQALYEQYVAAQDKTNADMATNATTYFTNNSAEQTANMQKETTTDQIQQNIANIQNEETTAINDCPNGNPGCKQTIMQNANIDLVNGQNQETLATYGDSAYLTSSQATAAQTAAINSINQNTAAAVARTSDTAAQQQYTSNAATQINEIKSAPLPTVSNAASTGVSAGFWSSVLAQP